MDWLVTLASHLSESNVTSCYVYLDLWQTGRNVWVPDDKELWRMVAVKGVSDDGCSYIVDACKAGEEVEVRAHEQPKRCQQRIVWDIPLPKKTK